MVTVFDTITITKTITIRENEAGDTLRMTTVTDKTKATTRDRYHDVHEKVVVKTDTVYVERDSLRLTAYSLINENDNENKKVNRVTQSLKWLFLTLVAIIVIIILMKIKLRR